jgi:hypothetical protein
MLQSAIFLLVFKILLYVVEHKEAFLLKQLIEIKRTLGLINLLLKHLTQILNIDVRILNYLVGSFTDKNNALIRFVK